MYMDEDVTWCLPKGINGIALGVEETRRRFGFLKQKWKFWTGIRKSHRENWSAKH